MLWLEGFIWSETFVSQDQMYNLSPRLPAQNAAELDLNRNIYACYVPDDALFGSIQSL